MADQLNIENDKELEAIRQKLIAKYAFDLYNDPLFIEAYICNLCGMAQTKKQDKYDALHPAGFSVEIKFSALIFSEVKGFYYAFSRLQGTSGGGKNADVYILVGQSHNQLRIFLLPAFKLNKRVDLEVLLGEKIYSGARKWLRYEVTLRELPEALHKIWEEQKRPYPLFKDEL